MTKLHDYIISRRLYDAIGLIEEKNRFKAFVLQITTLSSKKIPNYWTYHHYNKNGITALQLATDLGWSEIVKKILENDGDPNIRDKNGIPSIHHLALINNVFSSQRTPDIANVKAILDSYLRHNVDIGVKDSDNCTVLHNACGSMTPKTVFGSREFVSGGMGHIGLVKELVNYVSHTEKDKFGRTPLFMAAATRGNGHIVEFLISKGAHIDELDNDGLTPLHYAVVNRCVDTVKVLLECGANTGIKDIRGRTPLHTVMKDINKERNEFTKCLRKFIAMMLIKDGAVFNEGDNNGYSPIFYACATNYDELLKSLVFDSEIFKKTPYFSMMFDEGNTIQNVYLTDKWDGLGYVDRRTWVRSRTRKFEPYNAEEYINRKKLERDIWGRVIDPPSWYYDEYSNEQLNSFND